MSEFIYIKHSKYSHTNYYKFKFSKETLTQIVAENLNGSGALYRFDKKSGREKGCNQWQSPMILITQEDYRIGRNKQIDANIALKEKEISVLNEDINKLRALLEL